MTFTAKYTPDFQNPGVQGVSLFQVLSSIESGQAQNLERQEMADEHKTTKAPDTAFDFSCCSGWSRMKPDQTQDWDWAGMMSKMMEMCSGMGSEPAAPEESETSDTIV